MLIFLDAEGNALNDGKGKHLRCATTIDANMLIHYLDMVKDSPAGKDK